MGRNKLLTGILLGAAVGGLAMLFDRETREYTGRKLSAAKTSTVNCVKNPSNTVMQLRTTVDKYNTAFVQNAEQAINALEQVGETIEKFQDK
ncbi:YtxH domain-containing protein [Lentibacillus sp. JNUCC-1]|uniref:YtxH domain-containing protein n=1 Tax=Lentibacillus sp. JNUCC-1 TaxID=2654513 RepID=UPI0012E9444B|nr:YtxH domain-containing protein [Lentibacillus sp. JNUCC-1]